MKNLAIVFLITMFSFSSFADFYCASNQARQTSSNSASSFGFLLVQVIGEDVHVEYSIRGTESDDFSKNMTESDKAYVQYAGYYDFHSFTYSEEMTKIDELTYYKADKKDCTLLGCRKESKIKGYEAFKFTLNKGANSISLKKFYIKSPGRALSEEHIIEAIEGDVFKISEITANSCLDLI